MGGWKAACSILAVLKQATSSLSLAKVLCKENPDLIGPCFTVRRILSV